MKTVNRRMLARLKFTARTVSILILILSGTFSWADGPHEAISIASVVDLQRIGTEPGYPLDGHYVLSQDIDASETAGWNEGAGFDPIGTWVQDDPAQAFTGRFDGQGHSIDGLVINRPSRNYVGLFGAIGIGGIVEHVSLADCDVTGNDYVGGLVGWNAGEIRNSDATVTLAGQSRVGGLVGYNAGTVARSHSAGVLSGSSDFVGGLAGSSEGLIRDSHSACAIPNARDTVGGLVGWHGASGIIRGSHASGTVSGRQVTGGLVGRNLGNIADSYATGRCLGSMSIGHDDFGGLVGNNAGAVLRSYSTGAVSGYRNRGGLVGRNSGSVSESYYDRETSGQSDTGKGEPKDTAEMMQRATFAGWDFARVWVIAEDAGYPELPMTGAAGFAADALQVAPGATVRFTDLSRGEAVGWAWAFGDGDESADRHPSHVYAAAGNYAVTLTVQFAGDGEASVTKRDYIQVHPTEASGFADGSGTAADPYQVATAAHLDHVRHHPAAHYRQVADIDLYWYGTGAGLAPIGAFESAPFTGRYEGNGHRILNLTLQRAGTDYAGLFAHVGAEGVLSGLRLEGVVLNADNRSGALAGRNDGLIEHCRVMDLTATGLDYVGGLAGWNAGEIRNSDATVTIAGQSRVGGLVGYNSGTITRSHSAGVVSGSSDFAGGLAGGSEGLIRDSYSGAASRGRYNVGGLVGRHAASGIIRTSYAAGSAGGSRQVGGLVGQNLGTIRDSYATGSVWRATSNYTDTDFGGLVGLNSGSVSHSYSAGPVSGAASVGGMVAVNSGSVMDSYYDREISGRTDTGKGIPKTTAEMRQRATFAGWDFANTWLMIEGETYPYLLLMEARILSPIRSGTLVQGDSLRFLGVVLDDPDAAYLWQFGADRTSDVPNPGAIAFPDLGQVVVTYAVTIDGGASADLDNRVYTVVEDSGDLPDLRALIDQAPASAAVGRRISVDYTVRNIGSGQADGTWTDALYLSEDPYLDINDTLLTSATGNRSVEADGSYQNTLTATIPPVAEGDYYLILSVDNAWTVLDVQRLNNEASAPVSVYVPLLEEGVSRNATYDAGRFTHYYRLNAQAGANPLVSLLPQGLTGVTLSARLGELPTESLFDCRSDGDTLLIPAETDGIWYLRVHGPYMSAGGEYAIRYDTVGMTLLDSTPMRAPLGSPVTLTLSGVGFAGAMRVDLVDTNGVSHAAENVTVQGYTGMTADFGADALSEGVYTVRATDAEDRSSDLPDAFEVLPFTVIPGGTLTEDAVWGGVLRIEGNVTVPNGRTLQILPGSTLEFAAGRRLDISGRVEAGGTVAHPVRFVSAKEADPGAQPAPGDWTGLIVHGTGRLLLEHFEIRHAVTAINADFSGADVTLSCGIIRDNSQYGIYVWKPLVDIRASNVVIVDNGLNGIFMRASSRGRFRNCTIVGNGFAGSGYRRAGIHIGAATMEFDNCIVAFNANGIDHSSADPSETTVRHCVFYHPEGQNIIWTAGGPEPRLDENNNIVADPLFVNRVVGNYELAAGSPAIDAGRGLHAPPTDILGRHRFDDLGISNTGTGLPPYVDIGAYERQTYSDNADLVIVNLTRPNPEFVATGATFSVQWTVANQGVADCEGPWDDGVYLTRSPHLSADAILLAAEPFEGLLEAGESYTRSVTLTAPEAAGVYYLMVRADMGGVSGDPIRWNNDRVSDGILAVGLPSLALDSPVSGTVARGQWSYIRLDAQSGAPLLLTLEQLAQRGMIGLYVRYGVPPTLTVFDDRVATPGNQDRELRILEPRDGVYYIGIYAAQAPAGPIGYNLSVTSPALAIHAVTPSVIGDSGMATLRIVGDEFTPDTQVQLTRNGMPPITGVVTYENPTVLCATFDLDAAQPVLGAYDVVVTQPDLATVTQPSAVTVQATRAANLDVQLTVPALARPGRDLSAIVRYANTGTVNMPSPMLTLQTSEDIVWLAPGPDGETSATLGASVSFLAISSSGPASVLRPGQSETIAIRMRSPFRTGNLPVTLYALGGPDDETLHQPIDWAVMGVEIRPPNIPDEAWTPLLARLRAQVGETWGDYVAALRAHADHLAEINQRVYAVKDLFGLAFVQAAAMGLPARMDAVVDAQCPAPGLPLRFERYFLPEPGRRARLGPLGRGWMHAYHIGLYHRDDGSIAIHGPSRGFDRTFAPDGRGGYTGGPADGATLTVQPDGSYRLRERNGVEYRFRADGAWKSLADANGNTLTAEHDAQGRMTALAHSSGDRFTFTYAGDRLASLTDHAGRTTHYAYDATGEYLVSVTDPAGAVTEYDYLTDADPLTQHHLTAVTRPDGSQVLFTYDALGRLASQSLTDGEQPIFYAYGNSAKTVSSNALGGVTSRWLDRRGRVAMIEDALGRRTRMIYDADGNLARTIAPGGVETVFTYDETGNLVSARDPMGHETTSGYGGPHNRLLWMRDANGNAIRYAYDDHGNISRITYEDGTSEAFQYDADGKLLAMTNRRGTTLSYDYDARGQVVARSVPDGSGTDYQYTYDALGNLTSATGPEGTTSFTYDPQTGRMTRVDYPPINGKALFLSFEYDALGRRTRSTDQDGDILNYSYDAAGRLERMTDGSDAMLVEYEYDAAGRMARKTLGNGVYTEYTYDAAGQLLALENRRPDDSILSFFHHTYDQQGRRTSMETHYGSWSYEYDLNGQLTRAVLDSTDPEIPDQDLTYIYDPVGNRVRTVINGEEEIYISNRMNQYTQIGNRTLTYDLDGNLVGEDGPDGVIGFDFDAENRLIGMTHGDDTWSYLYDALGQRIAEIHNGVITHYMLDALGEEQVLKEFDGTGGLLYRNVFADGPISRTSGPNETRYYVFDPFGSSSELTDHSAAIHRRYFYLPLGDLIPIAPSGALMREAHADSPIVFEEMDWDHPYVHMAQFGSRSSVSEMVIKSNPLLQPHYYAGLLVWAVAPPQVKTPVEDFIASADWCSVGVASMNMLMSVLHVKEGLVIGAGTGGITPTAIAGWGWAGLGAADFWVAAHHMERALRGESTYNEPYYFLDYAFTEDNTFEKKLYSLGGKAMFAGMDFALHVNTVLKHGKDLKHLKNVNPLKWAPMAARTGIVLWCNWGGDEEPNPHDPIIWLANEVGKARVRLRSSETPEDKFGPAGYDAPGVEPGGEQRFILPGQMMAYRIEFWNKEDAEVPTQDADIIDDLDPDAYDFETFEFTRIGFLSWDVHLPEGQTTIDEWIDARPDMNLAVRVVADFNPDTGRIYWWFYCVDPDTGTYPEDPHEGFLPPFNPVTRYELGWVEYRLRARADLDDGAVIRNQARVRFDFQPFGDPPDPEDRWNDDAWEAGWGPAPKDAPWVNTIDTQPPTSAVNPLPPVSPRPVLVTWGGSDDVSGIAHYDIYVSREGAPYILWLAGTTETEALFEAEPGVHYRFFSVATDNVGHREGGRTTAADQPPDARTTTEFLLKGLARTETGEVVISWESAAGLQYRVLSGTNLTDAVADWMVRDDDVAARPPANTVTNIIDATESVRFFRIERKE